MQQILQENTHAEVWFQKISAWVFSCKFAAYLWRAASNAPINSYHASGLFLNSIDKNISFQGSLKKSSGMKCVNNP